VVSPPERASRLPLPLQLDGTMDCLAVKGTGIPRGRFARVPSLCVATGDKKSRQELDQAAERVHLLHRALTIRGMETREMRTRHDTIPDWVFVDKSGKPPFTKGTIHMDKADIEKAMDMFYKELGWDEETGAPLAETYQKLGLGYVIGDLGKKGLLP